MKTTKILTFIILFTLTSAYTFAQSPAAAKLALDAGTLDKAKEKIDAAEADEKNKEKFDLYYFKGLIYAAIANDQTDLYKNLAGDQNPVLIAKAAYETAKTKALNKKGEPVQKDIDLVNQSLTVLGAISLNYGVGKYQKAADADNDADEEKFFQEALDHFLLTQDLIPYKAGATEPADVQNNTTLGYAYSYASDIAYRLEKSEAFEKSVKQVIEKLPESANKTRYYALYAFHLKDKVEDKEKALAIAEKGIQADSSSKDPENLKLLQNLALNLYVELNKIDQALASVDKTIQEDPNNPTNYFNKGILYEKQNNIEKALDAYEKSIAIKPTFDAMYNAGALFFNKGAEIKKEADQLTLAEYNKRGKEIEDKAKIEFTKALPYFEKLIALNLAETGDDKLRVLGPLSQLYNIFEQKDKAKRVEAEIKILSGE
ncbi:MAG: hypothetical protein NW226_21790 [Microscillaceae bacterium]|nr:hypothetical protein [Microscillaceae bacterium]